MKNAHSDARAAFYTIAKALSWETGKKTPLAGTIQGQEGSAPRGHDNTLSQRVAESCASAVQRARPHVC